MSGIFGKKLPIHFAFFCQFKKDIPFIIVPFKKRLKEGIPLGKVTGELAGVACSGGCLYAVFPVHIGGDGFVHGSIFLRKIVVIFIVGIKIFHFFFIQRDAQASFGAFPFKVTALCRTGEGAGERRRKRQFHDQLLVLRSVNVLVIVGLYFFRAQWFIEQVVISQQGKELQHAFHIIGVVQRKRLQCKVGRIRNIAVVYTDQFSAAVGILPFDAQEPFHGFLLAVRQAQAGFIRGQTAVNIYPGMFVKIIREMIMPAFLQEVWQVKVVAVKMNQMGIFGRKLKEGGQNLCFFFRPVGKPLFYIPFSVFVKSSPDQVEAGTSGSKTGSFYVKE